MISCDHKAVGRKFIVTGLAMFLLGGLLALAFRWHLAWPSGSVPLIGKVDGAEYNALFTMHASIMVFLVIVPLLTGGFGNLLIPLMIGSRRLAYPRTSVVSYWMYLLAIVAFLSSFFVAGGAAQAGWTSYAPLAEILQSSRQTQPQFWTWINGQNLWLCGVFFAGLSSIMTSIDQIATVVKLRVRGMALFRMPLTVWALFFTAVLALLSTPVLIAALIMQLLDRTAGTSFFNPGSLYPGDIPQAQISGGGQVLLWQHLFWFYSHPAVYLMVLPAMGIVSDLLAVFARKPVFGYRPMVYSLGAICVLSFMVWAHHMFVSGMNPGLAMGFMLSTLLIAVPSGVKVFNWLGTLWRGSIRFTTPMLFALSFISMFAIGGLSGIFLAATPVDMYVHDTYFVVAHIHYIVFGSTVMAIFGGIFYWFPKMYGRKMNEWLGRTHWLLTFVFLNTTFFGMHLIGIAGHPRRIESVMNYDTLKHLQPMNVMITVSALLLGGSQLLFVGNFFYSMFRGPRAEPNPWHAATLEWASAPAPADNFPALPVVVRGPYEYSLPGAARDWLPQCETEGESKA